MIRNVCILAHGSAGKTSLAEAMLHNAGASDRFGKVADGTTVMDFDPEEIKRKISINTAVASFDWKGNIINVIDTPGYFDFVGEVLEGIRVADSAIIVLSGKSGVTVGAENSWRFCENRKIPRMFFINKLDDDRANFSAVLESLRDKFGKRVAPFQVPIKEGEKIIGYVDIIEMEGKKYSSSGLQTIDIPDSIKSEVDNAREMILESVAETDEALMEKYFSGEEFTNEEIRNALRKGLEGLDIFPVLGGSATSNSGVIGLMDALSEYMPGPHEAKPEIGKNAKGEEFTIKCDAKEPLVALVFKTVADPYVGKLSYFKVLSGEMSVDMKVINATTGDTEKISQIYYVKGKKQIDAKKISAGDIGAVTKLTNVKTGDTLCAVGNPVIVAGINFPKPNLTLAIITKEKGGEEKISSGLIKLMDEDKTFMLENNAETKQMLIRGMGEQQLTILMSKLKNKFGVTVELIEPRVPYRETIRKKVKVEGKHKKQSGGHGQYGHVWVEFEPTDGEALVFEEKIFGGSVPKNYFPAVEKGLQESMQSGVLAGYPVVSMKATLVDGSYHAVDSSEMAFKVAASLAFKKGMEEASPVLLEPIGHLEVNVPDAYMGDVIGDINKRRGRVIGTNEGQLIAEVPMAEMHKYATDLRSMSQARGSFSFEFERYEEAPANVAQKIVEESKQAELVTK